MKLLVQMFVSKQEEISLGIPKQSTAGCRRENNILDSDGFDLTYVNLTRRRSDTVSTSHSNTHDPKRQRISNIAE